MNAAIDEQTAFAAALACATPAERKICLEAHCGGDAALRQRVEALLQATEEAGDFLESPAIGMPDQGAAGLPADDLCEKPGDRIGRYKLLEKIGEGGCGVVYMAEQEEPVRRRVALKIIKPGMDTRAVVARFEAERQALALMDHPNIARVFDGGATPAGRPYFVMELVRGVPITTFCDEAQCPTAARLRLFVQVCQAVQHAHQKGIIHRDLKPSNILVTVNDGVPVPKVIDFGIAKATATGQPLTDKSLFTRFHAFIGTPAYTSPEQAEMSSVDVDTRSDIYSLGVLLYELLTGRTPFDGAELVRSGLDEMRRVIRTQDPPFPSNRLGRLNLTEATALSAKRRVSVPELTGAVRGDLDWIVMKCLEKDRTRRYETASSLAADVQCHLDHEPIAARPPSLLYRLGKLVQRHQGTCATLVAFAVVLCAGIVFGISQAMRAHRGEQQAMAALEELRASAPAYLAQARSLAARGKFPEAIEKLDHALRLRPADRECLLTKARVLESGLRFPEAAAVYRILCAQEPANVSAQTHLSLCGQLGLLPVVSERTPQWRETLARLFTLLMAEGSQTGSELHEMAALVLDDIRLRLAGTPFLEHLTQAPDGALMLDLKGTTLTDLGPLRGLPLQVVDLVGCPVSNLGPFAGLPLVSLNISGTKVTDLAVLAEMPKLRNLAFARTAVTDLTPLRRLPLEWIDLNDAAVTALAPLRGLKLQVLRIGGNPVRDLAPLAGMSFQELDCHAIPARDFSPLATCPELAYLTISETALTSLEVFAKHRLRTLDLSGTAVTDLAPLAGMPLLNLHFQRTPVTDLTPLLRCPTLVSILLPTGLTDAGALRVLPNVRYLSHRLNPSGSPAQTAAEFWKESGIGP